MVLRRLVSALSTLLLAHMFIAQSLAACGSRHRVRRVGASDHCERMGTMAQTDARRPHRPSSHHTLRGDGRPAEDCCTVMTSCAPVMLGASVIRTSESELVAVAPPAVVPATALTRGTGPEPPPPRLLGL